MKINLFKIISLLPLSMRRLSWERKLVERSHSKEIKKAREDKDHLKLEELRHTCQFEIETIAGEEEEFFTNQLVNKARRLRVPVPTYLDEDRNISNSDYWEIRAGIPYYLTPLGISKIRDDIRKEERWRLEVRASRVVWLSAIIGILGALTGLVAVWLKRQ
ncbi:MAG: hypothetical protein ACYCVG_12080 [Leptospirillum sp.]